VSSNDIRRGFGLLLIRHARTISHNGIWTRKVHVVRDICPCCTLQIFYVAIVLPTRGCYACLCSLLPDLEFSTGIGIVIHFSIRPTRIWSRSTMYLNWVSMTATRTELRDLRLSPFRGHPLRVRHFGPSPPKSNFNLVQQYSKLGGYPFAPRFPVRGLHQKYGSIAPQCLLRFRISHTLCTRRGLGVAICLDRLGTNSSDLPTQPYVKPSAPHGFIGITF
jgi:hypothetical protein